MELEAVWLQMAVYKAMPLEWAAIRQAWREFVLASLEKPYPRPLKAWGGFVRTAVQKASGGGSSGGGRASGGRKAVPDHSKGF